MNVKLKLGRAMALLGMVLMVLLGAVAVAHGHSGLPYLAELALPVAGLLLMSRRLRRPGRRR
jgi:hypothetical protein